MMSRVSSMFIAAAVVIGMGGWVAFGALQEMQEARQLHRVGVQSLAAVSQKWIVPDESPNDSHRIKYTFALKDNEYTYERSVPVALYRVVESGSGFQVIVSPDNPALHEIFPGQLAGRARNNLTGGLIISALGLGIFFFAGGGQIFRRRR